MQDIKDLGRARRRHPLFKGLYHKMLIYRITNLVNGKIYIGLTTRLGNRFKSHVYHGMRDGQLALHRSIRKHGLSNFTFEVVEVLPDRQTLSDREQYWIAHHRSNEQAFGYNLNSGGYKTVHGEETVKKMRDAAKNKREIFLYDRTGKFLRAYGSINDCARALGARHCTIRTSIVKGHMIKKAFVARYEYSESIPPHVIEGYVRISKNMRGNRNGTRYVWRVEDSKTGLAYEADSLLNLSRISPYKYSTLHSVMYGRTVNKYRDYLTITKRPKGT